MNSTPLEDQVHDALHRTADPLERTPFTVTDVRTRARRIQRRRTAAAGAAVAAVLAIAIPVGLSMVDPAQRSEVPPATQPPAPTVTSGTVLVDPRSAATLDRSPVALMDVDGPRLIRPDGSTLDLPRVYDELTPLGGGWIGVARNDAPGVPARTVEVLTSDLEVEGDGEPVATGGLVVSPDGSRVAWSEHDGTRWRVRVADTEGGAVSDYLEFPPSPEDHEVAPIGFVSDVDVAVTQNDGRGTLSTFVGTGGVLGGLPGPIEGRSASPVTGVVAGLKGSQDGRACSAVVEGVADTGATVWDTCDHTLGPLSPGGQYVLGFAPEVDGNGSPTIAVLDAATGREVVTFQAVLPRRTVGGFFTQVAWERDEAVVVRLFSGEESFMMRLGLDGTVQRIDVSGSGPSGLSVAVPG